MSRIGRTWRVPTEACAYQVPREPYLENTSVSAWVYSARLSRGTAQSSIKLTGLPSPLRLIMILRPALRTSHRFFCKLASGIATTDPARPRSPIKLCRDVNFSSKGACASPENSTNRIASGVGPLASMRAVSMVFLKLGLWRAKSIMVRSTNSTAVGPSLTICCALSIALKKLAKFTTPSTLCCGKGANFSSSDLK